LTPKEENDLFICKLPEVCNLLDEIEYNQKKEVCSCLMMDYWSRKVIKYPTEEDTYLSTDAKKILEKVEPNKEKGKAIYETFNRV
jgi:hypothetical protein